MAKHKYIKTPEIMLSHFDDYVKDIEANPRITHVLSQRHGEMIPQELRVPLTIEGFECFCYDNDIIKDLGDYFANKEGRYEEYATICRAIRNRIRKDQIEGGMVGQYNPSITQRLNNLTDKQDIKVNAEVKTITGMEIK